jgi:hypothetical protein
MKLAAEQISVKESEIEILLKPWVKEISKRVV